MNESNGGKQRMQHDTTASGEAKGLQAVLEERGFDVSQLRAKCSPVCPIESQNCCMAQLLSQQEDFINQESMLETLIKEKGLPFPAQISLRVEPN